MMRAGVHRGCTVGSVNISLDLEAGKSKRYETWFTALIYLQRIKGPSSVNKPTRVHFGFQRRDTDGPSGHMVSQVHCAKESSSTAWCDETDSHSVTHLCLLIKPQIRPLVNHSLLFILNYNLTQLTECSDLLYRKAAHYRKSSLSKDTMWDMFWRQFKLPLKLVHK